MKMNLTSKLEAYFPRNVFDLLKQAGSLAESLKNDLYLVGGVVRDLLLERANLDLDLVVEGDAIQLARSLADKNKVKLVIHSRFGTAKLHFEDFNLDIATARKEVYIRPGALPDVQPGTIAEDLFRRDFSINAMALFLNSKKFGEVIDLYNGRKDINNCRIRILHSDSFKEDATRIFRAFRYEQRLGFCLERSTSELIKRDAAMIKTISGDRLRHELMLILKEEYPEKCLRRLDQFTILKELQDSLRGDKWLNEKFGEARQLNKISSLTAVYLCLLVYRLTQSENEQLLQHLNFPKTLADAMCQALTLKARLVDLQKQEMSNNEIYKLLINFAVPAVEANMVASQMNIVKQRILLYLTELRIKKPLLNGERLKQLGVPQGPELGRLLSLLLEKKLDEQVRSKSDEEKFVLAWLKKQY